MKKKICFTRVPLLGLKMMSDADWKRITEQNAADNRRKRGKQPLCPVRGEKCKEEPT